MAVPPKNSPKPASFGKKEEPPPLWKRLLPWVYAIIGIAAITTMVIYNPKQKPLVCRSAPGGLTSFGNCTTD